jgi:nicotinamidase-related amidase
VDSLQPADITVEKVAYSAFYQSRMEFTLSRAGIKTLMVCGIVTNGGVASTVRDAHVRDFQTITLSDGCAAFSPATHNVAIQSLATVGEVITIAEAIRLFEEG